MQTSVRETTVQLAERAGLQWWQYRLNNTVLYCDRVTIEQLECFRQLVVENCAQYISGELNQPRVAGELLWRYNNEQTNS